MAGPLREGQSPRPGRARTPGCWAPRGRIPLPSDRGGARSHRALGPNPLAPGACRVARRDGVLLLKKKKKIWVREQDSSGDPSGPWHRIGGPSLSEPRSPEEGTQPGAAGGRGALGPSRGRPGRDAEAHPEQRGLVTFHRRLASSPAQLCPPHGATMDGQAQSRGWRRRPPGSARGMAWGCAGKRRPAIGPIHTGRREMPGLHLQPQTRRPLLGPREARALPRVGEGRPAPSL